MQSHHGAWVRYGDPLTESQITFAAGHYSVVILQPWETEAARTLKALHADMVVLCYKCLSSSRSYERGPVHSSGVSHTEAEEAGERWFAHRADGSRIEWAAYPGHWQMAVWDADYRERWCDNVDDELDGSVWDGVMADNDIYDDYYGLRPPIEGGRTMDDIRSALDLLVTTAGQRLNSIGKILVPNIAESRRQPGRWARHAAFGGGLEEVWLAYETDQYLDADTCLAQAGELLHPGLKILRTASDGSDTHPNFLYGLAAMWVLLGGQHAVFTATAHDGYSATPFIPELDADLGRPLEDPRQQGNGWSRSFTAGWAAVNLNHNQRRRITFEIPTGLRDVDGRAAPERVTVEPHHGALFVRN
jgi:hypothetical protein